MTDCLQAQYKNAMAEAELAKVKTKVESNCTLSVIRILQHLTQTVILLYFGRIFFYSLHRFALVRNDVDTLVF